MAAEIAATGAARPPVLVADVGDSQGVREAIGRASDELGGIDILVNNAAVVWPLGPTAKVDPADWEAAFGINVFAVLRLTQAVLPPMLERGRGRADHPGALGGGAARPPAPRRQRADLGRAVTGALAGRAVRWRGGSSPCRRSSGSSRGRCR